MNFGFQRGILPLYAGVMELVDVADSKSAAGDSVWVRVPSPAPQWGEGRRTGPAAEAAGNAVGPRRSAHCPTCAAATCKPGLRPRSFCGPAEKRSVDHTADYLYIQGYLSVRPRRESTIRGERYAKDKETAAGETPCAWERKRKRGRCGKAAFAPLSPGRKVPGGTVYRLLRLVSWEFEWLDEIQRLRGPWMDWLMRFLSALGNGGIFWIGIGLALLVPKKYRRTGQRVLVSIAVTFLVGNMIVKNLVDRARPYEVRIAVEPLIRPPYDSSFPSGHTMNGFTAAVALYLGDRRMGVPALFLASAIAFSRMYNLVHFPTDVLGGVLLGGGVAFAVDRFLRRRDVLPPPEA